MKEPRMKHGLNTEYLEGFPSVFHPWLKNLAALQKHDNRLGSKD